MTTTFEVHTDQLDERFLASVKAMFPHRTVAIAVSEPQEMDETEYLLSDPERRERLLRAIEDVKAGRNMVTPDQSLFQ
jgi:hypothetical protein